MIYTTSFRYVLKAAIMLGLVSFTLEILVGDSQFPATLCPSGCKHAATISRRHSLTETVLVYSFSP